MAQTLNQTNLRQFFNQQTVNFGSILPGMIISCSYSSPDGVHDPNPLIYVLEKEGDRIWGLNVHYNFALLGQAYNIKLQEVQKQNLNKEPLTQTPNQSKKDILKKFPKLKKALPKQLGFIQKPKVSAQTQQNQMQFNGKLDLFSINNKPENILRNYLFTRIRQPQKLLFNLNKVK